MKVIYDKCSICKDYEYISKCDNCSHVLVCYLCIKYLGDHCKNCNNIIKFKMFHNNMDVSKKG